MQRETSAVKGKKKEGPELPLGLGMKLAQDQQALDAFGKLADTQKNELIGYVKAAASGEDAKRRIAEVVELLRNGYGS